MFSARRTPTTLWRRRHVDLCRTDACLCTSDTV
ncbi:putative leader peptide [Rhodococcus sp. 27YEA15]